MSPPHLRQNAARMSAPLPRAAGVVPDGARRPVRRNGPVWHLFVACLCWLTPSAAAQAHPAPFSYLDVRVVADGLSGSLVLHDLDVARVLGMTDPRALERPDVVGDRAAAIAALMTSRIAIEADGAAITWIIDRVEPVAGQDAVVIVWRARLPAAPGHLAIGARMFPEDATHQTFVTVYERDAVVWQDVLNQERIRTDHYTGTTQGKLAVFRRFVASGIHHIAIGPDHILFVIGLLLPGGRLRRLLAIVTAFTAGHSITLGLATLSIVDPPAHIVEPLIALSIVFVGADNLLSGRRDRDVRVWVALVFGLVHGFGFASVLRDVGLPSGALGVSLFAFNLGVEIGQATIVVVVASLLGLLRHRRPRAADLVGLVGSVVVLAGGAWWFLERTFLARG
jgi:hydrogenase/urease accessory protein HupE